MRYSGSDDDDDVLLVDSGYGGQSQKRLANCAGDITVHKCTRRHNVHSLFLSLSYSGGTTTQHDRLAVFHPVHGELVKPSVLRLNSHWSCRVVVPPEYESDRNRECTCVCAYTCKISPVQLASLNEIGRRPESVRRTSLH
ncbi:unnamed protein product, partial [Brenthis ino]